MWSPAYRVCPVELGGAFIEQLCLCARSLQDIVGPSHSRGEVCRFISVDRLHMSPYPISRTLLSFLHLPSYPYHEHRFSLHMFGDRQR